MHRDLDQLEHNQFDVMVIGGGIYGISIARDAILRGLRVCLLEANDFGSGTSHNSLKIIHGGIRYFQHLNIKRVHESVREREMWVQISKRLVKPLKFVLPTYGYGSRGPLALGAAVKMHNFVAKLQSKQRSYPNGHLISKAECCQVLPEIDSKNISGGAVWYDGQIVDADRLHIELLKDAYRKGLCLANYIKAEEVLITSGKAVGAHVKDQMTNRSFDINASLVINATGPFAYRLLSSSMGKSKYDKQPLSKNFNLVIKNIGKDFAFGVKSKRASDAVVGSSKRVYFFTPWLNKTVIGTAHFDHDADKPLDTDISEELPGFMEEINEAYPSLSLSYEDVEYVYSGFTPAEHSDANDTLSRAHKTDMIDHSEADGIDNLLSVIGVKYTTARSTAEQVIDVALKHLKGNTKDISDLRPAILNYSIDELRDENSQIDDLYFQSNVSEQEVNSIYRENLHAHVANAIGNEMVLSLEDYFLRRNNLAIRGILGKQDIIEVAKYLASKFSWKNDEYEAQLETVIKKLNLVS